MAEGSVDPAGPGAETAGAVEEWRRMRQAGADGAAEGPAGGTVLLLAVGCGVVVANLYYSQPLIALIGPAVGLGPVASSLLVTLTQLGYAAGLLLLVPLGDLVENRRLVVATLCPVVLALLAAAVSSSALPFLLAALVIGLGSSVAQMLVPIAAHLTPAASRGRVVGNVMAGLLLGILLARPVASLVADTLGWRAVFVGSAAATAGLTVLLAVQLPRRQPEGGMAYGALLRSLWPVLRDTPVLQRRATYQAALFCGFSLFWTAVALHLAGEPFHLSQRGIALFALAGVSGAVAAPLAGRLADRGHTRAGTGAAMLAVLAAFLLAFAMPDSLPALVVAALLLDLGVQASLVLGQRTIYALGPETRSRLNGLHAACFFLGGAVGSALVGAVFTAGGWRAVSALGAVIVLAALVFFAGEFRGGRGDGTGTPSEPPR
ncbi:MFS transporter [Roseomonas sp. BN140053]|uniref:MFS transporter n=1 Tax=Roseomonas sp. BN140053 TaxID=3391898 RepID=UPI0039EA57DB